MTPKMIIGADEVGLGALAGPVVAAAVILPQEFNLPGLKDSKKLNPGDRAWLAERIKEQAVGWMIAGSSSKAIDEYGIAKCRWACMGACVAFCLERYPKALVVVDGNQKIKGIPPEKQQAIIKADDKVSEVSAASIIAKVHRDLLMVKLWEEYPQYDWKKNVGYGTKAHKTAINKYGATPYHRKSYAPIRKLLAKEGS